MMLLVKVAEVECSHNFQDHHLLHQSNVDVVKILVKNVGHEKTEQENIVGHNNETKKLVSIDGRYTVKKKLVKYSHLEAMEAPQLHQLHLHQLPLHQLPLDQIPMAQQ
jgi:hypothetical protein